MESNAINGNQAAGMQKGLLGFEIVQKTLEEKNKVPGQMGGSQFKIEISLDGQSRDKETAKPAPEPNTQKKVGSIIDKVT